MQRATRGSTCLKLRDAAISLAAGCGPPAGAAVLASGGARASCGAAACDNPATDAWQIRAAG